MPARTPSDSAPLPAMMPETCVPWPWSSYGAVPPVDEVNERGDALPALDADNRRMPGVGQVVMPVGNARVDHGDTDARAGVPVSQLSRARTSRHGDAVHLAPGRTVGVEALHERQGRELADDRIREFDHLAVDQSQLPSEPAAKLPDVRRGIGPRLEGDDQHATYRSCRRAPSGACRVCRVFRTVRTWRVPTLPDPRQGKAQALPSSDYVAIESRSLPFTTWYLPRGLGRAGTVCTTVTVHLRRVGVPTLGFPSRWQGQGQNGRVCDSDS